MSNPTPTVLWVHNTEPRIFQVLYVSEAARAARRAERAEAIAAAKEEGRLAPNEGMLVAPVAPSVITIIPGMSRLQLDAEGVLQVKAAASKTLLLIGGDADVVRIPVYQAASFVRDTVSRKSLLAWMLLEEAEQKASPNLERVELISQIKENLQGRPASDAKALSEADAREYERAAEQNSSTTWDV